METGMRKTSSDLPRRCEPRAFLSTRELGAIAWGNARAVEDAESRGLYFYGDLFLFA